MPPASQIEDQHQPPLPPPKSQPQPEQNHFSAAKRRLEDEDPTAAGDAGQSAPKRLAKSQDVIFLIVVPSRQIGKVIGKAGHRIQKIREDTEATIKIADAVKHEERVIIISSVKYKGNENMVSDAENALQQIATLILKEDDSSMEEAKVGALSVGHVAANTIRLLIAGSQAGCLIGMSGQNIEKLRSSSRASITILAPNHLPLCASAYESDRVVQISGGVPAVLKALAEIGHHLRENPPRQVISVTPAHNHNLIEPARPKTTNLAADYIAFEMVVSETFIGGVIGKCGSNISRIRIESGARL
ncbi:hypothetical protein PTKIN_Ptkin12aG0207000 [Pterospermum kingtungense]